MGETYMPYKKQLKDPRWQKRRLQISERDDFTCQWCGEKEKTLHVHHFSYVKGGYAWDSNDTDVITLCCDCHEFNHLEGLPSVIDDIHSLLIISPTIHGESMKILVKLCIESYKNK